jgi:hypothetical protein
MQTDREQKRLINCTKLNEITGCLIWTRQVSIDGHGRTMVKDANGNTSLDSAHRASYMAFYGEVPKGKKVRQGCGNSLCINPEHLELIVDV